jgi:hypothetical protein
MTAPRYGLGIINCRRYDYKRRLQADTWCRDVPADVAWFHVVGSDTLEPGRWTYDADDHLLQVGCGDAYDDLPAKVYLMCAFVKADLRPTTGLIRLDDDAIVHVDRLVQRIDGLTRCLEPDQAVYAGTVIRWPQGVPTITGHEVVYCRGVCNYLSNATLDVVVPRQRHLFGLDGASPFSTLEDVCMGKALASNALVVDLGTGLLTNDPTQTDVVVLYDEPRATRWRLPRDQARYSALYGLRRENGQRAVDRVDVAPFMDAVPQRWSPVVVIGAITAGVAVVAVVALLVRRRWRR